MPCCSMRSQVSPCVKCKPRFWQADHSRNRTAAGSWRRKCSQCLFESASKEHGGPGILFLPAIEIAMAIAPGTSQIVADLGVGVGHQATSESLMLVRGVTDSSSPLCGRREAVEVELGSAVYHSVTDLDHTLEAN